MNTNGNPLDLIGTGEPDSMAAAIRTWAVIGAIESRLKTRKDQVKGWIAGRLTEGQSEKKPGLGRAEMTAPARTARVTDPERFARWVEDRWPDSAREHVMWRTGVDAARVAQVCADDPSLVDKLEALIPGCTTSHAIVTDEVAEDVADTFARPDPDCPEQPTLGPVADHDGEVIPGLEIRRGAAPQLRVTVDRKAKDRYATLLEQATSGTDQVEGGDTR